MKLRTVFLATSVFLTACSTFQKTSQEAQYREANEAVITDELDFYGIVQALKVTIEQLRISPESLIQFGEFTTSASNYALALEGLAAYLDEPASSEQKLQYIKENFSFLELKAESGWGKAFVTGYYSPRIFGSRTKTSKFTTPLLGVPSDMLKIDVAAYYKTNPLLRSSNLINQIRDGQLRGRLVRTGAQMYVVPYLERADIVGQKGKREVLCYVDPVDAFFLEIQGSGEVQFSDGKILNINYADQNGHPYYPIGKALTDKIPLTEMSMQRIEAHLRSLPTGESQKIMNLNPSYVFFQTDSERALTAFGVEAQAGRTIATDNSYMPRGALALLTYPDPDDLSSRKTQFVINHDTGGAIRGPGRVDLFWGHGETAAKLSGGLKGEGRLLVLFPKAYKR